jgi:hypothetical protein
MDKPVPCQLAAQNKQRCDNWLTKDMVTDTDQLTHGYLVYSNKEQVLGPSKIN